MDPSGIAYRLKTRRGAVPSEREVKAFGDNKPRTRSAKISCRAKIAAVLKQVEGTTATVFFTAKKARRS